MNPTPSQITECDDEKQLCEWISVEDNLPGINQWVQVYQNKEAFDGLDADGYPKLIYPQDNFIANLFGHWKSRVTVASLRFVDNEGNPTWQQGQLASGHALVDIDYVTHWAPLMEPPKASLLCAIGD